ncbi:NIPSNAP family protein [Longispora sp. K20-0274]|uniref:NIPSNAP family protein n=1 Tax=Longispora sp. K20-0274 TaxID=3088255 RepID=UPI00399A4DA2
MMIVELRQYTLRPGMRDTLIDLFEREFVAGQRAAGIELGGRYRDLDDPDRFVWLRAFADMESRARALHDFYYGPVWQAHREVANGTMVDSDDVLLLHGPNFDTPPDAELVTATICHPADDGFAEVFERRLRPELTAAGAAPLAPHRTAHVENTFPALPVRTGEDVFCWFSTGPTDRVWPADANAGLLAAARHLRLAPVRPTG